LQLEKKGISILWSSCT